MVRPYFSQLSHVKEWKLESADKIKRGNENNFNDLTVMILKTARFRK